MRYPLVFFIFFLSCNNGITHEATTAAVNSTRKNHEIIIAGAASDLRVNKLPIDELTMGVMSLKENATGKVNIYDGKGQLWKTFSLNKFVSNDISPYSINLDYQNLVFRVINQSKDFYSIIVNEESGLTMYIRKFDPNLDFETWDTHILKVFSVDFKARENPIRKNTDNSFPVLRYNEETFYHPIEVKGDWLKIKWEDNDIEKYGWIKWKAGNKLLLTLFYIA